MKGGPKKTRSSKGRRTESSKFMEDLRDFVRTRGADYLKDPNISSVGIGYKIKDNEPTKEISIQFTVDRKVVPEEIESINTVLIPKSFKIKGKDIPTDVIERKFTVQFRVIPEAQLSERKKRRDPILPGISVANIKETAGTIGCIVYDREDGTPYILSNWHVLQGPDGFIGDEITQPGSYDDNRVQLNRMGTLVRSHLGHAGDCAVATIEDRGFEPEIIDLDIIVEKIGDPELGDKVVKSGRTTGVTYGIVTRVHTITKIDYGGTVGEQEVGCFEIEVDPNAPPENGEVSMGGDSGSAWLFRGNGKQPTNIMAGLHFAGEGPMDPTEHALACYPKSIFEKLAISLSPPLKPEGTHGTGFAQNFLKFRVRIPKLSTSNKKKAFVTNGTEVIDYTHFSLALNTVRRFAFWVAWNIDGESIRKLSRKGIPFVIDPRIPEDNQVGNQLYVKNRLDRGHIARRADLLWGGPAEARKANVDSFFFTNITPQMDDFNQGNRGGLWGRLEDAVFEDTEVEMLRVSLLAGPVFHEDDREFKGIKLPREFWKVIVFVENKKLKAKAFLLTQSLDELEAFELDRFKVYQIGLTEIEERCGLTFPASLKAADSVGERLSRQPESLAQRKPLGSLEDIDWS